jgi:pyruvate/2-oxoglutarate dehydrogenase complex dihydrolipoamide dehydrogenase (E3) component
VDLHLGAEVHGVTAEDGAHVVRAGAGGEELEVRAEGVLVAAGRTPNTEGLGLEGLGVSVGRRGIETDARSRTRIPSIYAVGDVAGRHLFTHAAANEAAAAVRDMFFPGSGKPSGQVPWCTFTDPELASVGLTASAATEQHGADAVRTWRRELTQSDRARADGATAGRIVLVTVKERLVGAHVLAPAAGEMIHELALAVSERRRLRELAGLIHVYPTVSTSFQQIAAEAAYEHARRFSRLVRRG